MKYVLFLVFALGSAKAVPVVEDINRFDNVRTFASSMSDVDGDMRGESYYQDQADVNGRPVYMINGEAEDNNDDVKEAFDIIVPDQNLHGHMERQNDDQQVSVEPLDDDNSVAAEDLDGNEINAFAKLEELADLRGQNPQVFVDQLGDDNESLGPAYYLGGDNEQMPVMNEEQEQYLNPGMVQEMLRNEAMSHQSPLDEDDEQGHYLNPGMVQEILRNEALKQQSLLDEDDDDMPTVF